MKLVDGLYVLRLDLPQRTESSPEETPSETSKNNTNNNKNTTNKKEEISSSAISYLNSCRLLCRLQFIGGRCGSITGNVKLISVDEDNNMSSDNGSNDTKNVNNNKTKNRATMRTESFWSNSDINHDQLGSTNPYSVLDSNTENGRQIEIDIFFDRLDGILQLVATSLAKEIAGQNNNSTNNDDSSAIKPPEELFLHFRGVVSGGQGVGKTHAATSNDPEKQISSIKSKGENGSIISHELRMVMTEVHVSQRCANCGDPLDISKIGTRTIPQSISELQQQQKQQTSNNNESESSPSTSIQQQLEYCSSKCKTEHQPIIKLLQSHLAPYFTPKASRCIATFDGTEFNVFWRSVTATTFLVLVEPRNCYQIAYEMLLDVLIDARQGMKINMISNNSSSSNQRQRSKNEINSESSNPTTELLNLNLAVYDALIYSAISNGCVALASACLNQLHVWCEYPAQIERQFLTFYDVCIGGGWDGLRLISTLGEYVMIARPLFECASLLIESALKSNLSTEFWYRLETAKGVLISLYNINGSVSFTPAVQHLRSTIVPEQQRETLLLLAKVFLLMAARSPDDQAQNLLQRAEECYTDAIEEDRLRQNLRRMAQTTLSMAALCTMIRGAETKGAQLKLQGIALLQSVSASPTAHRQQQHNCISTIVSTIGTSDELGVGVVDK